MKIYTRRLYAGSGKVHNIRSHDLAFFHPSLVFRSCRSTAVVLFCLLVFHRVVTEENVADGKEPSILYFLLDKHIKSVLRIF